MINRQGNSSILPFYAGIVGAGQCESGHGSCVLARGIVADDAANTVTFHLTAPDPDFLYKLAFSWAYAVPAGTPDHLISAAQLPATGPYMTSSLVPERTWTLVRNPRFREWSSQAQPAGYPDRIILRLDVAPSQAVADVEDGRADALLLVPAGAVGDSGPFPAATARSAVTLGLTLNTRLAFEKLAARLPQRGHDEQVVAVNGGPLNVQATCQILPPTMLGYRPYCPYTIQPGAGGAWTAPNLSLARRLVQASGTLGDKVTVLWGSQGIDFPSLATARYVVSVLDRLGYRASLRTVSSLDFFSVLGDSRDGVQAGFFSWYQDYPSPSDFIDPLLTCSWFLPASPDNINDAEFCDPQIDAQAEQALTLEATDPVAAASRWAAIDHEVVDQAPWVPLYCPLAPIVLSARTGNYQFHPYWGLLLDQLWVR